MKIHYNVSIQGSVYVPTEQWEDLKTEYDGDLTQFAQVTVEEELGIFQGVSITGIDKRHD